jgi:hypothetical protein
LRSSNVTLLLVSLRLSGSAARADDTNRLAAQPPIRSRTLLIVSEARLMVGQRTACFMAGLSHDWPCFAR